MFQFIQHFLRYITIMSITGSLFGRPEKYGLRILHVDRKSSGPGRLLPLNIQRKPFFQNTIIGHPEYDAAFVDAAEMIDIDRIKEIAEAVIPGGLIMLFNVSPGLSSSLQSHEAFVVERFGPGAIGLRPKLGFFHKGKRATKSAGYYIAAGTIGGIAITELYRYVRSEGK